MTANLSSAATVALCIFLSCNLHNYCFGSWTLAAEQLDTAPGIRGTDARHAPSAVPSSAIPAEAEQQQAPVAVRLKKLKRTSLRKNGTALSRRTKTVTAAKVVLSLTAVLGLLVASVKLYQCRQKLPANTSKQAAGSTGRRLAEGGSDDKPCKTETEDVEEAIELVEESLGLGLGFDELGFDELGFDEFDENVSAAQLVEHAAQLLKDLNFARDTDEERRPQAVMDVKKQLQELQALVVLDQKLESVQREQDKRRETINHQAKQLQRLEEKAKQLEEKAKQLEEKAVRICRRLRVSSWSKRLPRDVK